MLTVREVAARTKVSAALVYGWIADGVLPHFRIGKNGRRGSIRVAEGDLEAFLLTLRRGPARGMEKSPPPAASGRRFKHLSVRSHG